MKTFFIVLGLLIALSSVCLGGALLALLFVNPPMLLPVIKAGAAVLFLSGSIYVLTLITIPHGRVK